MIRRILTIVAAAATSLSLLTGAAPARAATCVTPGVVAHRGGVERYVENTRNAFRDASNVGANFWETDVRFTSDNVPVIMHDETVDRTTTGTGAVADLTSAQWQALRTIDDQPLPTLADVMNDQSVDRAYMFLEPKVMPTEAQWATFIAALTSRVGAGGPRPAIESFDPAVLDQVAVRLPTYTRALVQSVGDTDPADVLPHATILLKHHDAITASRLQKWTGAGLKVYAWADITADPETEWERIADYGNDTTPGQVSGYITAFPAGYLAWKKARVC